MEQLRSTSRKGGTFEKEQGEGGFTGGREVLWVRGNKIFIDWGGEKGLFT